MAYCIVRFSGRSIANRCTLCIGRAVMTIVGVIIGLIFLFDWRGHAGLTAGLMWKIARRYIQGRGV